MKISEMNKVEILDFMRGNGEINRPKSESQAWQRAFTLARQNGLEDVELGCAKCYQKVREWMERV